MSRPLRLYDIAHARAGDKGDTSNVCLFAYAPEHYPWLLASLSAERLRAAFPKLLSGPIRIYPLSAHFGVNIVMERALEGGVNASLNLDGHGKSWSFLLLGLEVVAVEGRLPPLPGREAGREAREIR